MAWNTSMFWPFQDFTLATTDDLVNRLVSTNQPQIRVWVCVCVEGVVAGHKNKNKVYPPEMQLFNPRINAIQTTGYQESSRGQPAYTFQLLSSTQIKSHLMWQSFTTLNLDTAMLSSNRLMVIQDLQNFPCLFCRSEIDEWGCKSTYLVSFHQSTFGLAHQTRGQSSFELMWPKVLISAD